MDGMAIALHSLISIAVMLICLSESKGQQKCGNISCSRVSSKKVNWLLTPQLFLC